MSSRSNVSETNVSRYNLSPPYDGDMSIYVKFSNCDGHHFKTISLFFWIFWMLFVETNTNINFGDISNKSWNGIYQICYLPSHFNIWRNKLDWARLTALQNYCQCHCCSLLDWVQPLHHHLPSRIFQINSKGVRTMCRFWILNQVCVIFCVKITTVEDTFYFIFNSHTFVFISTRSFWWGYYILILWPSDPFLIFLIFYVNMSLNVLCSKMPKHLFSSNCFVTHSLSQWLSQSPSVYPISIPPTIFGPHQCLHPLANLLVSPLIVLSPKRSVPPPLSVSLLVWLSQEFCQTPLRLGNPNSSSVVWRRSWLCFPTRRRKEGRKKKNNPHLASSRRNDPTWLNFGNCLLGVWRVFGNCLEGV